MQISSLKFILYNNIDFSDLVYMFENWKSIFDIPFSEEIKLYIINIIIELNCDKYILWINLIFRSGCTINQIEYRLYPRIQNKQYDLQYYKIHSDTDSVYEMLTYTSKKRKCMT